MKPNVLSLSEVLSYSALGSLHNEMALVYWRLTISMLMKRLVINLMRVIGGYIFPYSASAI